MQIRFIISDLDGTLLNAHGKISDRVRYSLARAMDKGIGVTLATGRHWSSVREIVHELEIRNGVIVDNGAMIIDPTDEHPLYHDFVSVDTAQKAINIWREEGVDYFVFTHASDGERIYYDREPKHKAAQQMERGDLVQRVDDCGEDHLAECPKLLAVGSISDMKRIGERMNRELQGKARVVVYGATPPRTDYGAIEIFAENCNKATAARVLMDMLGIPSQAVLALGDDINDMELIQFAGVGVAMGNAIPIVKAEADHVTLSYADDGLAVALERLIFGMNSPTS